MTYEIIGINKVDFTDKNGSRIFGTTLYYNEPIQSGSGIGVCGKKVFVWDNVVPQKAFSQLGTYNIEVDLSGKIKSVKYVG